MPAWVSWRSRRSRLSRGPAKIFRGAVAIISLVILFTSRQYYNVWMLHSNFNSQTGIASRTIFPVAIVHWVFPARLTQFVTVCELNSLVKLENIDEEGAHL